MFCSFQPEFLMSNDSFGSVHLCKSAFLRFRSRRCYAAWAKRKLADFSIESVKILVWQRRQPKLLVASTTTERTIRASKTRAAEQNVKNGKIFAESLFSSSVFGFPRRRKKCVRVRGKLERFSAGKCSAVLKFVGVFPAAEKGFFFAWRRRRRHQSHTHTPTHFIVRDRRAAANWTKNGVDRFAGEKPNARFQKQRKRPGGKWFVIHLHRMFRLGRFQAFRSELSAKKVRSVFAFEDFFGRGWKSLEPYRLSFLRWIPCSSEIGSGKYRCWKCVANVR